MGMSIESQNIALSQEPTTFVPEAFVHSINYFCQTLENTFHFDKDFFMICLEKYLKSSFKRISDVEEKVDAYLTICKDTALEEAKKVAYQLAGGKNG